jgi:hypothetical protein
VDHEEVETMEQPSSVVLLTVIWLVLLFGIESPHAQVVAPDPGIDGETSIEVTHRYTFSLEAAARNQILGQVATFIRDNYDDPEAGEALADSILAQLEQGGFDSATDERSLVAQVMAVIRIWSRDQHFIFRIRGADDDSSRERSPHGLRTTKMLEHGIAYLEFDGFPGDGASVNAVEKAMAELPEPRAIIFDIRDNNGGGADMVVLLCSQLLEEDNLLYTYRGRSGDSGEVRVSQPERHFGLSTPVLLLTSGSTLSAAEAFGYILQDYGRATLVGERTAGMANPSRTFSVGEEFELVVPFLLMRYGKSGGTHAGPGLEPDIIVSADSALDVALAEMEKRIRAEKH